MSIYLKSNSNKTMRIIIQITPKGQSTRLLRNYKVANAWRQWLSQNKIPYKFNWYKELI